MAPPSDDPFELDLDRAWAQGRQTWPRIQLARPTFATDVRAAGAGSLQLRQRGAELYLAYACAAGLPEALPILERELVKPLAAPISRMGLDDARTDEVLQRLRMDLLDPVHRRLARYAGRGSLAGWLRVVALRRCLRELGPRWSDGVLLEAGLFDRFAGSDPDPEVALIRARLRGEFQRAVDASLAALPPESKALLRLHYVCDIPVAEIAAVYGVHRATAARWLAAVRTAVLGQIRQNIGATLHPGSSSFRDMVEAVVEELTISTDRLLGQEPEGGR